MDDRQSAILWQLMQSLNTNSQANSQDSPHPEEPPSFESTLLTLRHLMSPKQQKIIDLMTKMQELQTLIKDLQAH